ncbi:MAG: hypothetical protein ACJ735_06790 [Actinomycetes bacterium]
MLLELRRSGGFTGTPKRWRVDAGADPSWRALVDAADLDQHHGIGPVLRRIALGGTAGGHHDDFQFELRVDGKKARFRGVHLEGGLRDLVDRIVAEGTEIDSR